MSNQNTNHPKVFITYSWDSEEHKDKVLRFSERLKSDGIDSTIDRDIEFGYHKGWQVWMKEQIDQADFILMVCTENYYNRFWKKEETEIGLGVMWEAQILQAMLYELKGKNTKFICIVFSPEELKYIPETLRRFTIDHWYRFLKQRLHWTVPKLSIPKQCERWSDLMPLMTWELWLAREESC